jgi:polysaccharide export outer membrane protein
MFKLRNFARLGSALAVVVPMCFGPSASAQESVTAAPPAPPAAAAVEQPLKAPVARPASPGGPVADYVIGPGDVLQVFVWRNQELSITVPVRPDGRISTPLVEDMVAVGKSPSALARDIEKVLSAYIRSPQVNVIVTTPVGTLSQVKAVGQVKVPQGVPFREGMRVLDLVLAVGGLTEFAAGNRAHIVRSENGVASELKVRLGDLLNKGDVRQNLALKPGDLLVVPESLL